MKDKIYRWVCFKLPEHLESFFFGLSFKDRQSIVNSLKYLHDNYDEELLENISNKIEKLPKVSSFRMKVEHQILMINRKHGLQNTNKV